MWSASVLERKHEMSSNELFSDKEESKVALSAVKNYYVKVAVSRVTSLVRRDSKNMSCNWKMWNSRVENLFRGVSISTIFLCFLISCCHCIKSERSSLVILLCFRIIYCLALCSAYSLLYQWRFKWMSNIVTWRLEIIFPKFFFYFS